MNFYFKDRMEMDLCEACVLPSLTIPPPTASTVAKAE
jgi:hypothetical protein